MNRLAYQALALIVISETATVLGFEPFASWNTPICWTAFIVFADAIVWRRRGSSWLHSAPREFAALALVSIPLWLVFEFYNRFIRNWYYVGLPENAALRYFGYAWAFATIWPAIFEAAELVSVFRGAPTYSDEPRSPPAAAWVVLGAAMLVSPFVVSPAAAAYLAAPVWLGFIFLLDPITARLGGPSLLAEWRDRRLDRTIDLLLSGLLCGVLWEFWNYWSRAKWHYTVPIMANAKIFEMPLPGYLGFPAFALECFTMYVFVRTAWRRATGGASPPYGRAVAL